MTTKPKRRKPDPGCLFCRGYVPATRLVSARGSDGSVTVIAVCRKAAHKRHAKAVTA